MGISGLLDIYVYTPEAQGLRVYISGKPWMHMVTVMCYDSPSPDKLEAAHDQARKCASLQAHCFYREGCWDWLWVFINRKLSVHYIYSKRYVHTLIVGFLLLVSLTFCTAKYHDIANPTSFLLNYLYTALEN